MNSEAPQGFFYQISDNGHDRIVRLFATTSDWNRDIHISTDQRSVQMVGNQQLRFTELDNTRYLFFSLVNKRISWDADLSRVKKDWNCALYTCDFSNLTPPQYLDAQSWQSRVEMDFQEASRTAYHFTAHQSYDRGGHLLMGIGGSVMNVPSQHFKRLDGAQVPLTALYGPGQYIDTTCPFHVSVTLTPESVRIELTQQDRMIWNETTDPAYLLSCRLKEPIHTFVLSLWTGPMGWLDGGLPSYPEQGLDPVTATLSNFCIDDL